MVVLAFFLFDDVDDEFLEVAVEGSDVYLTELLLGLVNLFVLDDVLIDKTLVGRQSFEDVEDIDSLDD